MTLEMLWGMLASQLVIGALVGFLIGFVFKKITKVAIALAVIFFMTLAYLEYNQFIIINYEQFALSVNGLLQKVGTNFVLPSFIATNLPLLASFGSALALGFKKG